MLHEVYAAWEEEQGLRSGRGYLMPVHLLTGRTRQHLRARGQAVDRLALRALILDALNHPRSGLVIEPRPFRHRAA